MKKLTIDFETRSAADLKKIGAAAYAQHPTTEVICLALKWEGVSPAHWYSPEFASLVQNCDIGKCISSAAVKEWVYEADIIEAHNAQFEYFIWKYVMPRYGFGMFDTSKLRCSAAIAAAYGLPRDLDGACRVAGVVQQKDTDGYRLMLSLCKPRKALKAEKLADPDWESKLYWRGTPDEFARLGHYCMQDVRAEEALSNAIPDLSPSEQKLWNLDLQINDRGVRVDVPACEAIIDGVNHHTANLKQEFQHMTGLDSPTQRDATLKHLLALGVQMDGLRKADVEKALASTEHETAKRILEIRKSLSKSSTAKYTKFLEAKGNDDRIRGCLMFHGAGTGRWAGRLIQPQNFPRGSFSDVEPCISHFLAGDMEAVKLFYGDPMAAASTCIRPMIVPEEGKDFICADYSSIEGRVLAWLAGEETALDVYRSGRDPYKVSASAVYNKRYEEITKSERQIGKVAELALGYNGGKVAFQQMGISYGVHVGDDKAQEIVTKWRASRPMTTKFWKEIERACMLAVQKPGITYEYRAIKFKVVKGNLAMRLPSGRLLWYQNPRIMDRMKVWGDVLPTVVYDGVNPETKKWADLELYGGLLTENAVQAISRDLLVSGMFAVEAAGYEIVFHVHDELVSEAPEGFGSVEEFESLMCTLPAWAEGLPIKAEGWRGKRYKK